MKQFVYFLLYLICIPVFAQNIPTITLADEGQLQLTNLSVNVAVIGNLAMTTYDMKFYNELDRTLEGELIFPLGEGQTVSKFAMDVNGKLRDAVIVEKELARVAFESTVRQNIDPGLLEKTDGNNYKARVYPILPKSYKHIVITFEQELHTFNSKQTYELPLGIAEKLQAFSVAITVFNEQQPMVNTSPYKNSFFQKKNNSYVLEISKKAHAPMKPIVIQIPNKLNRENLATHNGYFHYYKALTPKARLKSKPKKITILWDASYSMRYRNITNELKVLQGYFDYLQNVEVTFIAFNNVVQTEKTITIVAGNIDALQEQIKNVNYDGGTKLNLFQDLKIRADEVLLFSDGLENIGAFAISKKMPVYPINSLISANHQHLIDIAIQSGGNYINLTRFDYVQATRLLKKETYQFLGVKHGGNVREVYPKKRMNVYQDFAISGQFTNDTTLELLFGYGGNVTEIIPVKITATKGTKEVKRLWAKQKLNHLNNDKEKNKQQIVSLAKEYSLITEYTSMLILDRIEDYVRYRIEPPKELMEDYKRLLVTATKDEAAEKQLLVELKEELKDDYNQLLKWYGINHEVKKTKKETSKTVIEQQEEQEQEVTTITSSKTSETVEVATTTDENTNIANDNLAPMRTISGTITDEDGLPLVGAFITVKGTNTIITSDFEGHYSINMRVGEVLIFNSIGFIIREHKIYETSSTINIMLTVGENLEEVIVTAQSIKREKKALAYAVTTITSENITQTPVSPVNPMLQGMAAGINITTVSGESEENATIIVRSCRSLIGNAQPLYVIDGVVLDQNSFLTLNKKDIQEITVLKNAAAAAIYGTRGASGVIIITTKSGLINNKEKIKALEEKIASKIEMKAWNSNASYIKELKKETTIVQAYKKYLEIRESYTNTPAFYLDVADFFHEKKATNIAITILTNLMEVELHNHELLKAMAYKMEYFQRYDLAVIAYEKVLELRPEEVQSYRDLALAYEQVGKFQESYDLLFKIYDGQLLEKDIEGRYAGIEQIIFVELTRLVSMHGKKLRISRKQRKKFNPLPMDVRIVIDWNHNDTDIDLWVFDPNKEKAYYSNMDTAIGGRISEDFTDGYGPEEFILKNAINGEYKVMVNHYSDNVQKISGPTILKVTLYTNYGTKNEQKEVSIVRLENKKGKLEVGSLFFEKVVF